MGSFATWTAYESIREGEAVDRLGRSGVSLEDGCGRPECVILASVGVD